MSAGYVTPRGGGRPPGYSYWQQGPYPPLGCEEVGDEGDWDSGYGGDEEEGYYEQGWHIGPNRPMRGRGYGAYGGGYRGRERLFRPY